MESLKIVEFIDTYCIKVSENEDSSLTELMMDDHKCIEFNEVQYYIPENNMLFNEQDEETKDYLIENYLV